jgi:hypothetical protein
MVSSLAVGGMFVFQVLFMFLVMKVSELVRVARQIAEAVEESNKEAQIREGMK